MKSTFQSYPATRLKTSLSLSKTSNRLTMPQSRYPGTKNPAVFAGFEMQKINLNQASPSLPMASTGQPSRASMQSATSSSVVGCLCTKE